MTISYVYIVMHDEGREYRKSGVGIPLACFSSPEEAIKCLLMLGYGEADSHGCHWKGTDMAWIEEQPFYEAWKYEHEFIRELNGNA